MKSSSKSVQFPVWEDCKPAKAATPAVALRALRRRDELSRAALAEFTGIKKGRIADMKSGKRPISVEAAGKLAQAFKTSLRMFIDI